MTVNAPSLVDSPRPAAPRARPGATRFFHVAASLLLIALMFFGFRAFYLEGRAYPGRELAPPIRTLLVLHGAGMTLWVLLLLAQSALIAARKHRVHMRLGWIASALALATVVLGWRLGVEATRISPPEMRIWGLAPPQFMIVPLASIVVFAAFVAAGVALRKRPQAHRAMMLTATLAAMPAAVSRIDALNAFYLGTVWETWFGPFFMTLVAGAALVVLRCALARAFDRWLAFGVAALTVASALMVQMATSSLWEGFARWLLE